MNKKLFKAEEVIFKEGESANSMYKIETGEVKVIAKYGRESEVEVATIKAGRYFGEMGVIDNTGRSATLVAKSDVDLLVIDKTSFPEFVANHPEDAIKIMQGLAKSLRATTRDYADACKTIAELMEDDNNKPKKEGIWAKLKKFADVSFYVDSCANTNTGYVPYLYGSHYKYF